MLGWKEQPVQNICFISVSDGSFCSKQVPREESIAEVRDRYMDINGHAASYNWKALKWQGSEVFAMLCTAGLVVQESIANTQQSLLTAVIHADGFGRGQHESHTGREWH